MLGIYNLWYKGGGRSRATEDPYAVASASRYQTSGNIIGHVPCQISTACNLLIQKGGVIVIKVTGP